MRRRSLHFGCVQPQYTPLGQRIHHMQMPLPIPNIALELLTHNGVVSGQSYVTTLTVPLQRNMISES